MIYLIQFLCLGFEPAHVNCNVTVLLLQLLNTKNKILNISMCVLQLTLVIKGTVFSNFLQYIVLTKP